jgi:hypothetical protein
MNQQHLFLAPRSNETSRANFLATLESGYPIADIEQYLDQVEKEVLNPRKTLYIWGNQIGKKGSWEKMQIGDYVAFYASGKFVYVGKCILKKHSKEIAHQLWGNVPGKDFTWEYVFFLDELRPISIPLDDIRHLGGYAPNMIVMGFMPMNEVGLENIISKYGNLNTFFDSYSEGLNTRDAAILDDIAEKEVISPREVEAIDQITRSKNIDALLAEWEQRKTGDSPEVVERKSTVIRRNYTLVRKMKDRYENKCQICGFTFLQKNGNYYSEVAHIEPISTRQAGVDTPSNMIVLCPNHHKMLDHGSLKIVSGSDFSVDGRIKKLKQPLFGNDR